MPYYQEVSKRHTVTKLPYPLKSCVKDDPNYESDWDTIKRERRANHPKYLGGNYIETNKPIIKG